MSTSEKPSNELSGINTAFNVDSSNTNSVSTTNAKNTALKFIRETFSRPEQLEQLESVRRRIEAEKSVSDAKIKSAHRFYMDGIKSAVNELSAVNSQVYDIIDDLSFIGENSVVYKKYSTKLQKVTDECNIMSGINVALNLLNKLFVIPENIESTKQIIDDGNLLLAHKNLRELENIRDNLAFEHHKSIYLSGSNLNRISNTLNNWPLGAYFIDVTTLNRTLHEHLISAAKKALDGIFETVEVDKETFDESAAVRLVNVMRIVEREEAIDDYYRNISSGLNFSPIGRPKNWKESVLDRINRTVLDKFNSILKDYFAEISSISTNNTIDDRKTSDSQQVTKMLMRLKQLVMRAIENVQNTRAACFPPKYDILRYVINCLHKQTVQFLEFLAEPEKKKELLRNNNVNEATINLICAMDEENVTAVSVLVWARDYYSDRKSIGPQVLTYLMEASEKLPLISKKLEQRLFDQYISSMYTKMDSWTSRMVRMESQDWRHASQPPETFNQRYGTAMPNLLFQMLMPNLESATRFNNFGVAMLTFKNCIKAISVLSEKYNEQYEKYATQHYDAGKVLAAAASNQNLTDADKSMLPHSNEGFNLFIQYSVALANNCANIWNDVELLFTRIKKYAQLENVANIANNNTNNNFNALNASTVEDLVFNVFAKDLMKKCNALVVDVNNLDYDRELTEYICNIARTLIKLNSTACNALVMDFINSMGGAFELLYARQWLNNCGGWAASFFEALNDFAGAMLTLDDNNRLTLFRKLDFSLCLEFMKNLAVAKKLKPNAFSNEEKKRYFDQMSADSQNLLDFFKPKCGFTQEEDLYCYALHVSVNLIKVRDAAFTRFDLSKLSQMYPDFKEIHAMTLLGMRGDMTKEDIRSKIKEIDFQANSVGQNKKVGIFRNLVITDKLEKIFGNFGRN